MRGTVMSSSPCRFGDGHGDVHPEEGFRGALVGTPQGQHLIGRPRHGYANEITVADDAVGGVEVDPTGAGQIGLHPCMRVAAPCEAGTVGHEDIAADKPRRNTPLTNPPATPSALVASIIAHATATRMRLRLPMMLLVGSKSIQPTASS